MNSNLDNTIPEYKKCAGKGCARNGTISLKIRYLHKIGIFCDVCAKGLLKADLASMVEDANEAVRIGQSRKEEHVNFG
jgi:hypothetical protein